jgi:hypothetical protein
MRRPKRIEEIFGWSKIIGGLAQLKLRGPRQGEGGVHVRHGRL